MHLIIKILGGVIADKYGTKIVFGTAVILDGIFSTLIPVAVQYHYMLLVVLRVAMGLAQVLNKCMKGIYFFPLENITNSEKPSMFCSLL